MLRDITSYWWAVALRGVAGVLFSILAFVWPQQTLTVLVLLFAAYLIVDGILNIVFAFSSGTQFRGLFTLEGLTGIVVGAVALVWPGAATTAIIYLIAAWAVVTGIMAIVGAIWLRDLDVMDNAWVLGLAGIISIALGVVLAFQPNAGAVALVWTLGIYALIFGVLLIVLGFRMRSLNQRLEEREQGGRRTTGGAAMRA
jgi:uncharacterized membrane protein HdeD (DUF308 family)